MQDTSSRVLPFPQRPSAGDEALLGPSQAIAQVWSQIRRIAPYFRAAVLTGEPGCGAETAARALQALSPVHNLPFEVIEANGAERALTQPSSVAGLLFVPHAEQLSPVAQRSLLRKIRHRGKPLRIVVSLHADLRANVSAGRILPELAEALNGVRIALPSLRERTADIPVLAGLIAARLAERNGSEAPRFEDTFFTAASAFAWPGNLPQLTRLLDHLGSIQPRPTLSADHFTTAVAAMGPEPAAPAEAPVRMVRLDEVIQEHIRSVLMGCRGNKLRAAEILGISRSTLYRMLETPSEPGSSGPDLPLAI